MSRLFSAVFLLLLFGQMAFSNGMYPGEKQYLCDSVTRILVWTWMKNDTAWRFDVRIMEEITLRLQQKGYRVQQITFPAEKYPNTETWIRQLVSELPSQDALLVLPVDLVTDSLLVNTGFGRNRQTIVDPSGSALHTREIIQYNDQTDTLTILTGEATLYLPRKKDPVYTKTHTIDHPDAHILIRHCLSGIPKSRHPRAYKAPEKPVSEGKTTLEITPMAGYMFGSARTVDEGSPESINYQKGKAVFAPNFQYGISMTFSLAGPLDLSLSYRREVTKVDIGIPGYADSLPLQYHINYLLIGGVYNFRLKGAVIPFAGFSLGAVNLTPSNHYYRDVWYLALAAQAGAKHYFNKWLGIRLQADVLYQLNPAHAPFLYSMQTAGKGIDALTSMIQFGITTGVIFRF